MQKPEAYHLELGDKLLQKLNMGSIKSSSQSQFIGKFWEKEQGSISANTGTYTHCSSTLFLTQIILIEIILLLRILLYFIHIIKKFNQKVD